MAMNLGADDNGDFGNAFQRQMKRSIGVGGEPSMLEPKKVGPNTAGGQGNNPILRDWNGWQEQGDQMEGGPFGGAGGPMPIPDGGPNWRGNTTGGFDPVGAGGGLGGPQPVDVSNGSGAGGPMPQPWPQGASPVPGNPNAFYMQNHPSNPNSKYAQWKASQQQAPAPPIPGNTGIVPPHRQDGQGNIRGGPFGPPHPQGGPQIPQLQGGQAFNFSDMMQGQPQNGWNWGDLGNIRNRRF